MWRCYWLARLAAGYLETGDLGRAELALKRGLSHVASGDGGWCEGELLRTQIRLQIARSAPAGEVSTAFEDAITRTRNQPNRIFELPLVKDLAEFHRGTPAANRATDELKRTVGLVTGAPRAVVYSTACEVLKGAN